MRTSEVSERDGEQLFWDLAEELYEDPAVARGTMMGFACLRVYGRFFATLDHRSGELVVKLPEERVDELIEAGAGLEFAPAGRRFREWVAIETRDEELWRRHLRDARDFVAAGPAAG